MSEQEGQVPFIGVTNNRDLAFTEWFCDQLLHDKSYLSNQHDLSRLAFFGCTITDNVRVGAIG